MRHPLRILSVEDDPKDAELIQDLLEAEGIVCEMTRVDTQAALLALLQQGEIDLILADYSLPSFDGISALKLANKVCPEVPFIFVSGTLGEEVAIEALKIGATDYVLKTSLSRLVPSVQRALRESAQKAERKRAEESLRQSEAYLAEAQTLSHTGSFGWKPSTGELIWSEETFRIFQYDRNTTPTVELVRQRVHPEDVALWRQTIESVSQDGKDFEHEYRLLMLDGSIKHVHVMARALGDESGSVEYVGAVMDVTERKLAAEALLRTEAYLAEGQKLSHTGTWACNIATREMIHSSDEHRYLFGLSSKKVDTPSFAEFYQRIHPDDRDAAVVDLERAMAAGTDVEAHLRIVLPDGTTRYIYGIGHPLVKPSGQTGEFVGTVMDVTDRKRAEDKIRQSERELQQVLDLAPQHIGEFGHDGSRLYTNKAALDYYGLTLEEWRSADLNSLLYPQDAERVWREVQNSFLSGSPYETEVRLLRKDGTYRWFLFRLNPVCDEQGRIARWYSAGTDIEDRKQAEQRLQNENVALREEIDQASMFEEIVGVSPALRAVLSRVAKVAPTDSTVLITGETGTGKELIARAVHKRSQRSSRAFVSINCAAIPRDLIASELFGHEKGAFTGATQRHVGRFELAEGGTIFLDEIGELPAATQVALLRVLQEHEFERVGGTGTLRTNVRMIAATNRDLEAAIASGGFRSDLFYRLNVFPIEVPPLRERREDIPVLVGYFIDRFARKAGKSIHGINKKSLELLQSYPWPGNIRELQNVIERSVIVCETENFSVDESWLSWQPRAIEPSGGQSLFKKLPSEEKAIIEAALSECGGQVYGPSGAATKLGIPRSTLESKIRSLKINKNRFKSTDPPQSS